MTENPAFLTDQLITYIGNKRALLSFIGQAVELVKSQLNQERLHTMDMFSGSGIVGRFLKAHSKTLTVNDMEQYTRTINQCYLANSSEVDEATLRALHEEVTSQTLRRVNGTERAGFITELYAPKETERIQKGERCFYTTHNARYIDFARMTIEERVPAALRPFFVAPLLSQASVHANTAGIFKGFYKNSATGIGQFGGNGRNALSRICSDIVLPFPVLSRFCCPVRIFQSDANALSVSKELYDGLPENEFDLVYMDPPYNQHPYGSNYFMLNLITTYERPDSNTISRVSGIPRGWNRSAYNKKLLAEETFRELVQSVRTKFLVISFNNEGFIKRERMEALLAEFGTVSVLEAGYNAFRGSRNLHGRDIHVSEYLFVLDKRNKR